MRPLILSANDQGGGAGIAATRLHLGLLDLNVDSQMLVQRKMSSSPHIQSTGSRIGRAFGLIQPHLDRAPVNFFSTASELFHPQWVPALWQKKPSSLAPDIVNLHWICDGFMSIEAIGRLPYPIVWTLHDMWPLTGGCHYSGKCKQYTSQCGNCPTLQSNKKHDLSRLVWKRKQSVWRDKPMVLVSPSRWLAKCAAESSIFSSHRIEVIPNGIDLCRFKAIDKKIARQILNLPSEPLIVLFGAMSGSKRKGAHHLKAALSILAARGLNVELAVFGNRQQYQELDSFRTNYLGHLADEVTLCLNYAAADVFVAPSEQDNLPNTMIEAMASGTPCVAFKIGGMADIIDSGINGYLAKPFDAADLANGIASIIEDDSHRIMFSIEARKKAELRFDVKHMSANYAKLFEEILETNRNIDSDNLTKGYRNHD
jgi:glycosyltransferase involved in cell wall biosynthesis